MDQADMFESKDVASGDLIHFAQLTPNPDVNEYTRLGTEKLGR
jgi:hypothetical protein